MTRRALLGVLAAAFVVRLAVVLWLSDTVPHSDAQYYHMAAQMMAADWSFPFDRAKVEYYGKLGWWPPLYPGFISLVYRLVGVDHRAVVFLQVVLGTLVVWLVARFARQVGGDRVAVVAALIVALDPTYIFLTNILSSENLYVLWLALGLGLVLRTWDGLQATRLQSISLLSAALAGVVLGLGALTRAIGLIVLFVVGLWSRGRMATNRAWLIGCAAFLGGAAIVIGPWTLRNALVAGSPALVCFGGGLNFYFGHNPEKIGYRPLQSTPMAQLTTQSAVDREGYRLGLAHLGRDPFGFFSRGAAKIPALFGSPGYAPHENSAIMLPANWQTDPEAARQAGELRARQRAKNHWLDGLFTNLATAHSWLLFAGTLLAVFRWKRLSPALRLCVWIVLAWIGAHVVFWAQPRFRYPIEIPMAVLTAWVMVDMWGARRQQAAAPAPRRSKAARATA